MAFAVTMTNRQRRAQVDLDWLRSTVDLLAEAICANLAENPPEHLKRSQIKQMSERGNLSLALVSNRRIRVLNRDWRGKDAATDVLSFPLELDAPPVGLPWEFGEVVISVERAIEQAGEYGHSVERELAFLFVHGCLHVLGFDHEVPEDEREMMARQRSILGRAGLRR